MLEETLAENVKGCIVEVLGRKQAGSITAKRGSCRSMMCCSASCMLLIPLCC